MTDYRMFSEPALAAFRRFLAIDARTRNPQGAYDAMPRALRHPMAARDQGETDYGQEGTKDTKALNELMTYVEGKLGSEGGDVARFIRLLDAAFPNCLGELKEFAEPAEDDADADWPPSNAGGKRGPVGGDDEGGPVPFKGMPK
jgi:hypothetical protein